MASASQTFVNPTLTSQELHLTDDDLKIKTPSRMYIAGPTLIGKSEFAYSLVHHRELVYDAKFSRIVYCLPDDNIHLHTDFINRLRTTCNFIEIVEGIPDLEALQIKCDKTPKLIILDDLITKTLASSVMLQVSIQKLCYENKF